jgi:Domain of unknown function (DUF4864)
MPFVSQRAAHQANLSLSTTFKLRSVLSNFAPPTSKYLQRNYINKPKRRQCVPKALGNGPSSGGGGSGNGGENLDPPDASTEDAFDVAQECMRLFSSGQTSSIITYLPDAVIDNALERKRSKLEDMGATQFSQEKDLSFLELLELAPPTEFTADSFAMRGLVLTPPLRSTALSTLRITGQRCLQRYSVTTQSGEEMQIRFDLQLEEAHEPRYRGFKIVKKWFIKGLQGEPDDPEIPSSLSPKHGPESIILAQLAALKSQDAREVFKFASPKNRNAFNGDVELFAEMLGSEAYLPLLGHTDAKILRSTQMTATRNFAVVGVTSNGGGEKSPPQRWLYGWSLALQEKGDSIDGGGEDGGSSGDTKGCWMTEAVYPLGYGAGFLAL